jgi:hypothetical protein
MDTKRFPFCTFYRMIVLGLIVGCSDVHNAHRSDESLPCPAIVEGFFHSKITYVGKSPAISVRHTSTPEILNGTIKKITKDGILFVPARESIFYDPDTVFFSLDRIQWIVDEGGNVIYGTLPDRKSRSLDMELEIFDPSRTETKHTILKFEANQRFSYCLSPGDYLVEKIRFCWGAIDQEATSIPPMKIPVRPNVVNYIGDFFLDLRSDSLPGMLTIRTSINQPYRWGPPVAQGGVIVASMVALASAVTTPDSAAHSLAIELDSSFTTQQKLPLRNSLIETSDSTRH